MKHKRIICILINILIYGCSKSKQEDIISTTSNLALIYPEQNAACLSGIVGSDTTKSTIEFKWNAVTNAYEYELHLKNLSNDSVVTKIASSNSIAITLSRNTPYSWYVISQSLSTQELLKSDVWKFYNSGFGSSSNIPKPATIISPNMGDSVTAVNGIVTLKWVGSDIDGDIMGYDLYLGTSRDVSILKSNLNNSSIDINVDSNLIYYWKVVTKDFNGNTSTSVLHQFKVN